MTNQLPELILTVTDYLRAWGIEIPEEVKTRDEREPGRRQKTKFENKFYAVTRAYFARLAKKAAERIGWHAIWTPRKALNLDEWIGADFFEDDEFDAEVIRLLLQGIGEGAALFSEQIGIPLDYSGINKKVLDWAKKNAGKIVKTVDATSRDIIRQAVALFVETPGFTVGDIMKMLPFDEQRALRIAVTETTRAYAKGNQAGAEQLKAEWPDVKVVEVWHTNNDYIDGVIGLCPICQDLEGVEVEQGTGFYEPEDSYQDGYPPRHVNCLPGNTLVLPIGRVAGGSERWYEGNVVTIETLENKLTITPNHPILTPRGWVAAGEIVEGDEIICYSPEKTDIPITGNEQDKVSSIHDVFSSLGLGDFRVPVTAPDFHGDGANSKIATIRANGKVNGGDIAQFYKPALEEPFVGGNIITFAPLPGLRTPDFTIKVELNPTPSIMGGADLALTLLDGHSRPFDEFSRRIGAWYNASLDQPLPDGPAVDTKAFSEAIFRLSRFITAEKIVKISNEQFFGHVYNLQTDSGLFVAAGIIVHNCRCWITYSTVLGE